MLTRAHIEFGDQQVTDHSRSILLWFGKKAFVALKGFNMHVRIHINWVKCCKVDFDFSLFWMRKCGP